MPFNALPALQVQPPENNGVANFQASQANAQQMRMAKQQQEAAALEQIASIGLGVMGGKVDGEIDPARLDQAVALLGDSPLAARIKDNPELLRVATQSSLKVLQFSQDADKFEWAKKNAEAELAAAQAKLKAPMEVSAGASLWDPTTKKEIYTAPKVEAPDSTPTVVSIYDKNGREQKGTMGPKDAEHPDGFYPIGSPKAETPRPEFTVSQATAAGYADRMAQSDAIISDPGLTKVLTDAGEHRGDVPVVGNFLASPEYQQADQAKRDFINAIMRRESGAVISPSEFDNANKQYFPQPGDNEKVLQQKAANRKNAIKGVARAAGPAYEMPDTSNYLTGNLTEDGGAEAAAESAPDGDTVVDWTDIDWGTD